MTVSTPVALQTAVLVLTASGLFSQSPQPRSEEEREAELKRRVIATLEVSTGATVADVGCGDGFYTIPLAKFVGSSGKVFAVDIDDKELFKMKQHLFEEHLDNVQVEKGLANDPRLPVNSLDAAMIVNAYHEMPEHEAMLGHIRVALKQNGRFVLMERITDRYEKLSREEQIKKHCMEPQLAKRELESAGFEIVKLDDHFLDLAPNTEEGTPRWWLVVARRGVDKKGK